MPGLITPDRRFSGDDGSADPALAAMLQGYAAGRQTEQAVLTMMASARLLMPVLAAVTGAEVTHRAGDQVLHGEKASELALPMLTGRDGRRAIVAFTSMAALARWRPDARPLPAGADRVCQAAITESVPAVVVDVAGPVPLTIEGARLAALAAGWPVPAAADDPAVRATVSALVAADPDIEAADLVAGSAEADLTVRIVLAGQPGGVAVPGSPARPGHQAPPHDAARRLATALAAAFGNRFRRGVQIAVMSAPES